MFGCNTGDLNICIMYNHPRGKSLQSFEIKEIHSDIQESKLVDKISVWFYAVLSNVFLGDF